MDSRKLKKEVELPLLGKKNGNEPASLHGTPKHNGLHHNRREMYMDINIFNCLSFFWVTLIINVSN